MTEPMFVTHNRVQLALHTLRSTGSGHPLLLLHGLGESTPAALPGWADGWSGPVFGLDFTGHGRSTVPAGGGYSAEMLLADADAALAALVDDGGMYAGRPLTIVGRGLGAYVALMLAGARATQVRGAVLADGPGLAGGPVGPTSQHFTSLSARQGAPDPYALYELSRDLRPPDYATLFVRLAVEGTGMDEPIAVAAKVRPAWLAAVADEVGVSSPASIADALASFAVL